MACRTLSTTGFSNYYSVTPSNGQGSRGSFAGRRGAGRRLSEEGQTVRRVVRRGGRHTVYLRAAVLYLAGFVGLGRLARRHGGRPDVVVDVGNGVPFLNPLYVRRPVIALVHHVHREQWPCVLGRRGARFGWWLESRLAPWAYRR